MNQPMKFSLIKIFRHFSIFIYSRVTLPMTPAEVSLMKKKQYIIIAEHRFIDFKSEFYLNSQSNSIK